MTQTEGLKSPSEVAMAAIDEIAANIHLSEKEIIALLESLAHYIEATIDQVIEEADSND